MKNIEELWDISNRPSTRTKLELLGKVFDVWLTIWNKQPWIEREWYVFDLFAGRGRYYNGTEQVDGSPLIFLRTIAEKRKQFIHDTIFHLYLVERQKTNYIQLKDSVEEAIEKWKIGSIIHIHSYNNDCNEIVPNILSEIDHAKRPVFLLIDPTGLQVKKTTIQAIVQLRNPKDILLNYIMEGVVRTVGVARKESRGEELKAQEIKTIRTLQEFIGTDVNLISKSWKEILEEYVEVFTSNEMSIVGYDVKYPVRNDILYYLLFAVRNPKIADIVKSIYVKQKTKEDGPILFDEKEFYIDSILTITPSIKKIKRKSLLYRTKVEYGSWTINHIIGCKHGCAFPCYAMMMAKRFGWVKDELDWRTPRIATNALELLEKEIPKYRASLDFVHLCFMTDPFMYDFDKHKLIPSIKELSLQIIERLNREGIRVTTLTKGLYPDELLDSGRFLRTNEYGITLVSLDPDFKNQFEKYSSPYAERIQSLRMLSDAGLPTWVSMEPYPTPDLIPSAKDIEAILEKIRFVKKIVFGKLNYHKLVQYGGNHRSEWKNNHEFYEVMSQKVRAFCEKNKILYHIKSGTPGSEYFTRNIFRS